MTALAYTLTLTDGSELRTDPVDTGVPIPNSTPDLEVEDMALKAFEETLGGGDNLVWRCTVAGRRLGVQPIHILHVGVEVTR